jgi:hypothetical protein
MGKHPQRADGTPDDGRCGIAWLLLLAYVCTARSSALQSLPQHDRSHHRTDEDDHAYDPPGSPGVASPRGQTGQLFLIPCGVLCGPSGLFFLAGFLRFSHGLPLEGPCDTAPSCVYAARRTGGGCVDVAEQPWHGTTLALCLTRAEDARARRDGTTAARMRGYCVRHSH